MSLPPLKPDKTASGIIVDPRTLERVVPQSRRKDGSVRKEQRVRPGFTPQEDVGRFRSARQQASDVSAASKPIIPGSNRLGPAPSSATRSTSSLDPQDNPFAQQEQREKTKAQLKNEKRREKRREKVALSWDEEGDGDEDEDGDGGMQEAFKAADAQAGQKHSQGKGRTESQGAEQSFPPIDGNGGVPEESVVDNLNSEESKDEEPSSTVAALEPAPPGPSGASFETPGETKPTPPTTASLSPAPPQSSSASPATASAGAKPSLLADRKAELSPQSSASATAGTTQKPHPIQGGRKGPIGLAHPPPIEEDKPKAPQSPSRADADTWRMQQPKSQQQKQSNGKGKPNQTQNQTQTKNRNQSQSQSKTNPTPAPAPAPRERREVKVREGGHNDVSSLANRVKNLVLANTVGNAPREKTSRTATPTGSGGSAASEGKATPAA